MLDANGKYFIDYLTDLREGRAANEAGAALVKVSEGVHETAGTGSVTLTLRVALKKDSADVVEVVDAVAHKTPEERRDVFYFAPGGQLLRRRPRDTRPGLFDEPVEVDTGPTDEEYDPAEPVDVEPSDERDEPSTDDARPD